MTKEKRTGLNIGNVLVVIGLALVGALVIAPLLKKISNRVYRSGSRTTERDFIDNEPVIVRKDGERGDEGRKGKGEAAV